MLTRRRVIAALVVLVIAAAAYTAWLLYAAQRDLRAAEADARALRAAVEAGDDPGAQRALDDLQDAAGSAKDHTGGLWWRALTVVPVYGDDLGGVRALSASLDEIAEGAAPGLVGLTDDVDGLVADGRVDLDGLESVSRRVATADTSMQKALAEVADEDSADYVGALRSRYDDYVDLVSETADALHSARTASEVAPTMLGADGPRDYLLIFQNNAEIRSTGGLSGSWARLHTENGRLELKEQGDASDFGVSAAPVAPVSKEENAVYGDVIARYFQDPVMVPDFPRAAELFDAFWTSKYPQTDLDGVLTLDTVGLSYLLRGTGPVTSDGYTLTPETVVQLMLNQVYLDVDDPRKQDEVFTSVAARIFGAVTTGVTSPTELVKAVDQAVDERRLMVASFEDGLTSKIRGTRIAGELSGDDGATPHVDVTVNDATGSKMSYYLDYDTEVRATACTNGVQDLAGTMSIRQTISAADAAKLPDYITGGGDLGVKVGSQQVQVRLYAPYGGKLGSVFVDGVEMPRFTVATIDGRQVITLTLVTDGSKDVDLTWKMTGGPGQDEAGELTATPKVTPGRVGGVFASAC
ncbi:DUF4012 domain-containing protein [Nocardioides plantarum]|uniref:DUF4012 domain-containing protein n=1 Tax=Nocardioides plantarum TaxID=29299 RepID=A0ABV5K6I6_9ACTN|nr:DUF4012 domain-containing protein [Nocardioides plantarum]